MTSQQRCYIDLLATGHLSPLLSFMSWEEAEEIGTSGTLHGSPWPSAVTLDVGVETLEPGATLGLIDPEGATLGLIDKLSTTHTGAAAAEDDTSSTVTVWGDLTHLARVEAADFPELYLTSTEMRSAAQGSTALVTHLPPTAAMEKALDGLLAECCGTLLVVLGVGADLSDRMHDTTRAWQAALASRPQTQLALLRTGHDPELGLPLAVVAAGVAGCCALAVTKAHLHDGLEARLAALAVGRGMALARLDVTSQAPEGLLARGAEGLRDSYSRAVWPSVLRGYPPAWDQGFTVMLTGLSGSGKSTIARALAARLRTQSSRRVTLLDGDVVRRLLTSELGFSAKDRRTNVARIAWVAAQVTRHGGIAVCAPIAPYAAMRDDARRTIEEHGVFALIHVATSLQECERRDRKGLYARARRGEIPAFTGISDPYETPENAELVIDTVDVPVAAAVDLAVRLLQGRGLLD